MTRHELVDEIAKASDDIMLEVELARTAAGDDGDADGAIAAALQEELADALAFDDWCKRKGVAIDW